MHIFQKLAHRPPPCNRQVSSRSPDRFAPHERKTDSSIESFRAQIIPIAMIGQLRLERESAFVRDGSKSSDLRVGRSGRIRKRTKAAGNFQSVARRYAARSNRCQTRSHQPEDKGNHRGHRKHRRVSRRNSTHSAISVSSVVLCSSLFCRRNAHWTRRTATRYRSRRIAARYQQPIE